MLRNTAIRIVASFHCLILVWTTIVGGDSAKWHLWFTCKLFSVICFNYFFYNLFKIKNIYFCIDLSRWQKNTGQELGNKILLIHKSEIKTETTGNSQEMRMHQRKEKNRISIWGQCSGGSCQHEVQTQRLLDVSHRITNISQRKCESRNSEFTG